MFRALVVGGPVDFVRDKVGANLRKVGIEAAWHHEYQKHTTQRPIPKGCDLVVILTDLISHGQGHNTYQLAKAADVPIVRTQRKWSVMLNDLNRAGYVNGALPPAGEQLLQNVESLDAKGLLPNEGEEPMAQAPPRVTVDFPVRIQSQERTSAKTFDELVADLKNVATALMLAHDVTSITIGEEGIVVNQIRTVKVAL